MRSLLVFALAFLMTISGCHCGKKTDEEILLEKIDTTPVHLYLATKVAIIKSDSSPEAAEAKKHLLAALSVLNTMARDQLNNRNAKASPPDAAPSGSTVAAVVASGAPAVAPAVAPAAVSVAPSSAPLPSTQPPPRELTAADVATLVKALWGLKKEGKALVKARREDDLPPIIPVLAGADMPPELIALLDTNTEHSIFLMTLFALKFHPKNPVPVPPEILLYEAWMTRAEALKIPGLNVPTRAIKAMVYSQNELCDLTAAEGEGLEKEKGDLTAEAVNSSLKKFGAENSKLTDKEAAMLSALARGVAHGAAASCYFKRDEKPKALDELQKFIAAAHEAGVPPAETALARAYLAYETKDYETAKRCLEEAKSDPSVDEATKKEIDALTKDFTDKNDTAIGKFFDKTYFSALCIKLVLLRIERTGIFDEVLREEPLKTVRDYLFATTKALSSAKESIPSVDDARKKGTELLEGLTK